MSNGIINIEIRERALTELDVSLICRDINQVVVVKDCYIEGFDLATKNKMVVFVGCHFANSFVVTPSPMRQVIDCTFNSYEGNKNKSWPIKQALSVNGYHTPVINRMQGNK